MMQPQQPTTMKQPSTTASHRFSAPHLSETPTRPRSLDGTLRFLAISDFGLVTPEVREVARAMDIYAGQQSRGVDFVLGLGDNFYPRGVHDVHDKQFDTVWRETFIENCPNLRVPWRMVLGNHDYMGEPIAQIEYHYHRERNKDGLWYMPSSWYDFDCALPVPAVRDGVSVGMDSRGEEREEERETVKEKEQEKELLATFYALDTNACQAHVVWSHGEELKGEMRQNIRAFSQRLHTSPAHWKIVFGHHVMYTQGKGHSRCTQCLREASYIEFDPYNDTDEEKAGFNLEAVCVDGKVDAYFGGHEHIFQYHAKHGVHHFCCGASGADIRSGSGFYGGLNPNSDPLDWISTPDHYGFLAVELSASSLVVRFVNAQLRVLKEVKIDKPPVVL